MQRLFAVALVAVVLPVATARADWWSDARLVQRGIAHAVQVEWITSDDAATYRAILSRSTGAWRRLPGSRGSNLAAVLHDVGRQWQTYIAPRALALFGMLDTNTRYLGSGAMPPDGANILDADGVVYRAFAGHGLQFHPLANFARLNRLLADGNDTDAAYLAAALIWRAVPRLGALTWEYYFPFGGGYPPWTSGMVQAVAARAFAADGDYDVARKAYLALPALHLPACGRSLDPAVQLQQHARSERAAPVHSLAGRLRAAEPGSERRELSESGCCRRPDTLFDSFDTGAWSLYSLGGAESPLNYHVFDTNLLKRIATQTQSPVWTARGDALRPLPDRAARPQRRRAQATGQEEAQISIWVSKMSRVSLTIAGSTSCDDLSRGSHTLYWDARGRRLGTLRRASVSATDLAGNKASMAFPLFVRK